MALRCSSSFTFPRNGRFVERGRVEACCLFCPLGEAWPSSHVFVQGTGYVAAFTNGGRIVCRLKGRNVVVMLPPNGGLASFTFYHTTATVGLPFTKVRSGELVWSPPLPPPPLPSCPIILFFL